MTHTEPRTISLSINGEVRRVPATLTVAALLAHLGLRDQQVAVERNRRLVPRASFAAAELREGDALEIVTFLGGG